LVVAGVAMGVGEVQFVPPGGVGMRGWVDAERGRGCMVVGVVDMCARQLLGCRLVAPETSYLWWPSFPGSPLLGARSLHRGTSSKICAVAAPVPSPDHEFRCRGPGGIILAARGLTSGVLVGDFVCLLLTAMVSSTFGWTAEGLWVSSGTRPCAGGALRIWHIFRTADTTPGGSWVDL
jgi:hypothetical protein